jgi:L-alanine-DL-glutamate epimerase-like enolase superfamily enzyme
MAIRGSSSAAAVHATASRSVIDRIEVVPFSLPLLKPTKWGAASERHAADHVAVRVYSSSGAIGTAEAVSRPTIFGETQKSIVSIIEDVFAPLLIGRDMNDRVGYWNAIDNIQWNPTAKAALDIAIHDVLAQEAGLPLGRYLGGDLVPIPVSYMIALGDVQATVTEAIQMKESHGITAFKIKSGKDWRLDVERIKHLRENLGPSAFLFIDANQLYTPTEAVRALRMMSEYDVAMAEEPIPIHLARERKRLAGAVEIPILSDDSVATISDIHRELELGAIGILGIKPPRSGIWRSMQALAAAEIFGLPVWIGSQGVSDIGTMSSAHVYVAGGSKRIPYPADLGTFLRQGELMLKDEVIVRGGHIVLSEKPGIGAEINSEILQKYRIDK